MKSYQLTFFGPEGSVEANIDVNSACAEAAFQTASNMLHDTPYSFVEVWDGGHLLLLLGQAQEPESRRMSTSASAGGAR